MKTGFLRLQRLPFDEEAWHVVFSAGHSDCSSEQDCYLEPKGLEDFANAIRAFPNGVKDEVNLEIGEQGPKSAHYIRLRVFCYNSSGHTALEVCFDNNGEPPYVQSSRFCIVCELSSIDALGVQLLEWTRSSGAETMKWGQ